jgi:uncharacterized membrane-anchored protein YhcB (DUF1043 family)
MGKIAWGSLIIGIVVGMLLYHVAKNRVPSAG